MVDDILRTGSRDVVYQLTSRVARPAVLALVVVDARVNGIDVRSGYRRPRGQRSLYHRLDAME